MSGIITWINVAFLRKHKNLWPVPNSGLYSKKSRLVMENQGSYQNTCTLTHDKPITIFVPRPRSSLWSIISPRQTSAGNKSTKTCRCNTSFCASSYHYVSLTQLNVVCSWIETGVGGCTSSWNRVIRTHETMVNSQQCRPHIGHRIRNKKGRHPLDSFL